MSQPEAEARGRDKDYARQMGEIRAADFRQILLNTHVTNEPATSDQRLDTLLTALVLMSGAN